MDASFENELSFDAVTRWLRDRIGRSVSVTANAAPDRSGDTGLTVSGQLSEWDELVYLKSRSRRARVEVFAVGDAQLTLVESEFSTAARIGPSLTVTAGAAALFITEQEQVIVDPNRSAAAADGDG